MPSLFKTPVSPGRFFLLMGVFTLLLYFSGPFVVFAALPLAYATLREGRPFGMRLMVVLLVILLLLYWFLLPVLAAHPESSWISLLLTLPGFGFYEAYGASVVLGVGSLYFIFYLALAWGLVWGSSLSLGRGPREAGADKPWRVEKLYLFLIGMPLVICIGITLVFSVVFDFNILIETKNYLLYIQEKLIVLDQGSGLSSDEVLFLKEFGQKMVNRVMILLPAILVNMTLFIVWCNLFVARRWIKGPLAYEKLGDLTRWQLKDQWIWVLIGSAAVLFLNLYLLDSSVIGFITSNILLVLLFVYFFYGLTIVAFYLQKRQSSLLKLSIYFLIFVFFQIVAVVIVILGIFDFWVDFRKLKQKEKETV